MSEGTGLLSYALVVFLIYIYLPHNVFKFFAEISTDLGRRRDSTQLEEIIAAALPGLVLNVQAALMYLLLLALNAMPYIVDRSVIAEMIGPGKDPVALRRFVVSGDWAGALVYLALLYGLAAANGYLFGSAVLSRALWPRAEDALPPRRQEATGNDTSDDVEPEVSNRRSSQLKEVIRAIGWRLWYPFYHENLVPFFTWSVRQPYVFIRTVDRRLYHGRFVRYEKLPSGELDGIRLEEVSRYCFDEAEMRFRKGEIPLSDFHGTLYVRWPHIADINRVSKRRINELISEKVREMQLFRRANDLPPVDYIWWSHFDDWRDEEDDADEYPL